MDRALDRTRRHEYRLVDEGVAMRRSTLAATAAVGGLLLVTVVAAPAGAASSQVHVQVDTVGGPITCTVEGGSLVEFDPDDGPDGRSIVSFSTQVSDPDPACYDHVEMITVVARYRRERDQEWLTASAQAPGPPSARGSASVAGPVVDVEVSHQAEFRDAACGRPRPGCFPASTSFTTDPK
jgi:hypothetical protein